MNASNLDKTVSYGSHALALKEKYFFRKELAYQLRSVHIVIYPLAKVQHLEGLWLSPLSEMTQTGRKTRLIYDFSSSGPNAKVLQAALKEAMRFGISLHRLLECILENDPHMGQKFESKVDLEDACMSI